MHKFKRRSWILGAALTFLVIAAALFIFLPKQAATSDDPWAHVPKHPVHTDHTVTRWRPFESGEEVTQACLECHPEPAREMAILSLDLGARPLRSCRAMTNRCWAARKT